MTPAAPSDNSPGTAASLPALSSSAAWPANAAAAAALELAAASRRRSSRSSNTSGPSDDGRCSDSRAPSSDNSACSIDSSSSGASSCRASSSRASNSPGDSRFNSDSRVSSDHNGRRRRSSSRSSSETGDTSGRRDSSSSRGENGFSGRGGYGVHMSCSWRAGLQSQSPRHWPPRAAPLLSSPQELNRDVGTVFDANHDDSSRKRNSHSSSNRSCDSGSNRSGDSSSNINCDSSGNRSGDSSSNRSRDGSSSRSGDSSSNTSTSSAPSPGGRRRSPAGAASYEVASSSAESAAAAPAAMKAATAQPQSPGGSSGPSKFTVRAERLHTVLSRQDVDMKELKELLWGGVPTCCPATIRSDAWRIVLGYLPASRDRASHVLAKKRGEYLELLQHYYEKETLSVDEAKLLRQLRVDLPRTHSGLHFFTHPRIQRSMERALFLWAVKHPASGYVQGINDLLTPFLAVFLASAVETDLADISVDEIPPEILTGVEADAFWCLSRLLAHIQDNFTFGQPGIQRSILKLTNIVKRVDEPLYAHLTAQGVDLLQVSFRWMNCLLMREFPLRCVIRLWDTYIAEQAEGFGTFHVYVCAVFLVYWSSQLRAMNFQQIMLFIQNFPTAAWTEQEVETLLAEAFVLKSLFHAAPKHLAS